jgi:hypothetical protein
MTDKDEADELQNRLRPVRWHACTERELKLLCKHGRTEAIKARAVLELEKRFQAVLRRNF